MTKLLLLCSIFQMSHVYAQSEADLFEKAFGQRIKTKTISLPLLMDRTSLGEMNFSVQGENIESFNGERLRILLGKHVSHELLEKIPRQKKVNLEQLQKNTKEIELEFFPESLFVQIKFPAKYYQRQRTIYDNRPDILGKKIYDVEKYSHILNYWYEFQKNAGEQQRHELDLESNLTLNGYVLENDFDFNVSETKTEFYRRSTRLVKDFIAREARLQVGDIDFTTTNLQSQSTLLGFSYAKDYSLNPYKKIKPINQFEFILAQRSYVTIYVNERPVRSEILDKGRHSIEDLVLDYGRNAIRIVAREVAGNTKEFEFSWSGASELLREGLSLYSHNLGVKSVQNEKVTYQDLDTLTYSGFYQYGFSSLITGGISLQVNQDHYNGGPTLFTSTPLGNLRLETALSRHKIADKSGFTIDAELENAFNLKAGDVRTSFGYQYLSENYSNFDTTFNMQKFSQIFKFDFSWYLNQWINLSFDVNKSIARNTSLNSNLADRELYAVGLGLSPIRDLRISSNYGIRRNEQSETSHEFTIFLNYSFAGSSHHLNTFHDTENNRHTAQINYTPDKKQDAFYYRGQLEKSSQDKTATLTSGYKSRYFDSEFTYVGRNDRDDDYRAKLRGALIWTPTFLRLSPSVYNSFALIKGKNSLDKKKVGLINDVGGVGSKEFRQEIFLPELSPYHYYPIYMDPTHLEHGTSYDNDHFYIYPKYKSVINVELGNVKSHTVFGRLTAAGQGLKVGEFIRKDGYTIPFFTNRKGRFALESVLPGNYEIWVSGKMILKDLIIGADSETIINLGSIK